MILVLPTAAETHYLYICSSWRHNKNLYLNHILSTGPSQAWCWLALPKTYFSVVPFWMCRRFNKAPLLANSFEQSGQRTVFFVVFFFTYLYFLKMNQQHMRTYGTSAKRRRKKNHFFKTSWSQCNLPHRQQISTERKSLCWILQRRAAEPVTNQTDVSKSMTSH